MYGIKQTLSLRIPIRLLNIVKIIAKSDEVSVNQELIKLIELGIKNFMDKSINNDELILKDN